MKTMELLIVAAIATICTAAPLVNDARDAQITEYRSEHDGNGGYHFAYRTSDGTYREETGFLKNPGTDNEIMEVTGLTTWLAADGIEYTLSFIANENGYVATANHLPKSPEYVTNQPDHRIMVIGVLPPKTRRLKSKTLNSLLGR